MKTILIIFTMCGQPTYVVGQDEQGPVVGSLSNAPKEAVERLYQIVNTEGALILKRPLEDITGLVCV